MKLVPVPRGQKGPVREGWNKPGGYIEDPQEAQKYWLAHPEDGMGCVLGASGLCSLDLDNVDLARQVLCAFGVDIDALAAVHPTVVGNPARLRILFAVPQGVTLTAHKLSWPRKEEPGNLMHLFEMRAGPVQDVLPPSIHPGTGQDTSGRRGQMAPSLSSQKAS
jgi:putative DNA primase/helicase